MTTKKIFLFALLIVFICLIVNSSNTFAKENKVLKLKVAEVLAKYPAQNSLRRDQLSTDLIQLGSDGILIVCRALVPPGTGDDTSARFALNGLSMYTNGGGTENARKLYAKTLIKGLKSATDNDVKAFLISQLQLVGKDESVKALSKCLKNKRLCEPATQALVTIRTKNAKKALVKALGSVDGDNRITIIKALGENRCKSAVKKLLTYAESTEDKLRQTTLYALANIGDPSVEAVLSRVLISASAYERATAPSLYLLFAQRLGESGNKIKASQICRTMVKSYASTPESNIACIALSMLVKMQGKEAFDDLLAAMDSPDEELQTAALELSETIPGEAATAKWVNKMEQVSPATNARIISMLGSHGDKTALPILLESLKDEDQQIRLAAIPAVVQLGRNDTAHDLLSVLQNADEEEIEAVKSALLTLDTDIVVLNSAKALPLLPADAQICLIEILAERRASAQVNVVWDLTKSEDEDVRLAAILALENLAASEDLQKLIELLQQVETEEEITATQKALAVSVLDISEANKRVEIFLYILTKIEEKKQASLFNPYAQIGGERGLTLITELTRNKNTKISNIAIRTLANWKTFDASDYLIELVKKPGNVENKTLALRGYIRLTRESEMPDYHKVDLLKQAMASCEDIKNKKLVLKGLSEIVSIEALKYVASFMNDNELKIYAAMMVRRIALPQPDGAEGLTSPESIYILRKAISIIENDFEREQVNNHLNTLLKQFGFKQIFNGKDLTNWKGLVENPAARAKMSAEELGKKQAQADSIMRAHWKVRDGALVFDGEGKSLCTIKDYSDFEMLVDWKINKEGDSGIYLRGSPQVQIWDPAQWPEGSGGLYNNKKNPSKPLAKADNPIGEWNTFRIIMIGERVTVYLNNVLVVDNVAMENYWERDKPIYRTGQIELQSHHSSLYFRNVYIRKIEDGKNFKGLSQAEKENGFELLFNGKDMTGWTGNTTGYAVENGKMVLYPEKIGGNLYTEKEFSNFILRFEFKLTPGANNGLGIRAPLEGNAAYEGMELQILENTHPKYDNLKPYQYHGSIYGVASAKRGFLNTIGEWNFEEVTAKDNQITVRLNGETIVRANIKEVSAGGTIDGGDHPGLLRKKGHIGFLGHGNHVEFRNLRINELE